MIASGTQPILITGAGGMLANAFRDHLDARGRPYRALARADLDVTDERAVLAAVRDTRPDIILHCAAFTRVDDAESDPDAAFLINARSVGFLADAANEAGALLVYPGTDYVFDGTAATPYRPDSEPNPINVYGRSKLEGEAAARRANRHLIVRLSWLYGPGGKNFVRTVAGRIQKGQPMRIVDDQTGSPTWTSDAAEMVLGLIANEAPAGTCHATSAGSCTWFEFGREIARLLDVPQDLISPCPSADYPTPARRPAYSVLECSATERFTGPRRDWQTALAEAIRAGAY